MLEFSLAISVFAYRNSLKEAFKTTLQNSMRDSDSREENKEAVDDLQQAVRLTTNSLHNFYKVAKFFIVHYPVPMLWH